MNLASGATCPSAVNARRPKQRPLIMQVADLPVIFALPRLVLADNASRYRCPVLHVVNRYWTQQSASASKISLSD